ncbi:Na/Pi cotransporter family protein [Nitrincola tapanii]|uniref:Na/Pi cotransporter family protein n=1 Tax=Nitrincola tapanii TaxID=1708751 RepID=A0A5A9W1J5_9GAMM|nr:Na/Pi symporter [Nitrincola tapanii]KAA0874079.1 Na/Pi cotransporter family protein [Nitrincola tapanii]
MYKKMIFPALLVLLAYALWISADFMEIAAGIALFIFGMFCLEEGFKAFTGGTLESILRRSTDRLWKSLTFGLTSTTLMQSSTLVSLITISFVSAEMITLAAGIGIIMGANIGTTTGAWLIAGLGLRVNIAAYAMPILVFGVVFLMQKSKILKGVGYVTLGAGLLFFGIHYMKEGFEAFQGSFDLSAYAMTGYAGVLLFTLLGMLITVVMQSSHATLLIIITALSTGQVTYENALALAIGANLGSAITTAMGGLAANLGGKRLAIAHVIFNLVTGLVAILFIGQLAWLVDHLAALVGIAAENYLLKLALFHTVFNLLGVLLLTPFVSQLERFLLAQIQQRAKGIEQPLYLYPEALETPATAVSAVRKEVQHLFDNAAGLLAHGLSLKRSTLDSEESLSDAVKYTRRIFPIDVEDLYEEKIKSLHSEIVAFIGEAQTRESTQSATEELYVLRQASRDIVEAVKGMKHLHTNLSRYGLSSNLAIRERYDQIRLQLAKLLRELRQLQREEASDVTALSLDALKLSLQKSSRKLMDDLDEMIRFRRINPSVATSIMNDEAYVNDISHNLLDATRALLEHSSLTQRLDSLSLDEKELQALADQDASSV